MLKTTLSVIVAISLAFTGLSAESKDIRVVLVGTNEVHTVRPSQYVPPAGYNDTIKPMQGLPRRDIGFMNPSPYN